jgi:hypothetical protein
MTTCANLAVLLLLGTLACGPSESSADSGDADVGDDAEAEEEFSWDAPPDRDAVDGTWYNPFAVLPSSEIPVPRDWQLRRGIIHFHSPYSHDGCDSEGFVDGVRNEECFDQLRQALCDNAQDFGFLTDHGSMFADYEYPDVLLYADGDTLIERGGIPVANRIRCADGREVILGVGTEQNTMPIGLEHHIGDTPEARRTAYNDTTPAGIAALQAAGAVSLVAHTEGWEIDALLAVPLDGIEIYNLHQNLMDEAGTAFNMIIDLQTRPWRVPIPELGLAAIFGENDADLVRWSRALGVRRTVGILATDVHRNTFDGISSDGERIDSYRRLMHWFSNYVLLPAGPVDDLSIKDAIRRGRLYGAFDYLGYPLGFDFRAEVGTTVYELGDEVPAGETAELQVAVPQVSGLDPAGPQPVIRARLLRSNEGAWDEVAAGQTDLSYDATTPGVYRAEIRIVPEHLRPWLGLRADLFVVERIWVYSNPIYVGVTYAP